MTDSILTTTNYDQPVIEDDVPKVPNPYIASKECNQLVKVLQPKLAKLPLAGTPAQPC